MSSTDFFLGLQGVPGSPIDPTGPGGALIDPLAEFSSGPIPPSSPVPAIIKWTGSNWVYAAVPASGNKLEMALIGPLDAATLPLIGAGAEIVNSPALFNVFGASRSKKGVSGTTSIQLTVNGVDVPGAVLSWSPLDADGAFKSISISSAVVPSDVVAFSLLSAETGAHDVIAGVSE